MADLPLSRVQESLLGTFTDPRTTPLFHDRFLLRWAYLVKPTVDVRRLRRAHDTLVKRHDTLRMHFEEVDGRWVGRIPDSHPTGLIVEDIGDVEDDVFKYTVSEQATARMDVRAKHLFEIRLLRFGRRGDVVLIRAHHILVDAYSSIALLEEFFKLLLSMPLENRTMGHLEYVQYEHRSFARNEKDKDAYWEKELLPMGAGPNLGRKAKGIPIEVNSEIEKVHSLNNVATPDEMAQVARRATKRGETLFNYLLASFCDVLCEASGADDVVVCVNVSRLDSRIQGYIGNANRMLLIRFWHDPTKTLDEIAALAGHKMRTGLQYSPWEGFAGGGPVATAFRDNKRRPTQYMVHSPEVLGRLNSSNMATSLKALKSETLALGSYKITRVALPESPPSNRELQLTIHDVEDGKRSTLDADFDAFSLSELEELKQKIRLRLELDAVARA